MSEQIAELLVANLPRDLVLAIEEALTVGAQRAVGSAKDMKEGHWTSVLGQMRHFHMNETFHEALSAGGHKPTPLRGNKVIAGRAGIFTVGRFNTSVGIWNNARRSTSRRTMASVNRLIEHLVQPGLFDGPALPPVTDATVFFVAAFSPPRINAEVPRSIEIAVPDRDMKGWLFREPLVQFLARYEPTPKQEDGAVSKLKPNAIKKPDPKQGTE